MVFHNKEKLYRAVWPQKKKPNFWKKPRNGKMRVSTAAFIDPNGLSVEYGDNRSSQDVIDIMQQFFSGHILSFTVEHCDQVQAVIKHFPTSRSSYHCEVHGSESQKVLSDEQAEELSLKAVIEYSDEL